MLDRVDALDCSFKGMKKVVNNLTKFIAHRPPTVLDFNSYMLPVFSTMNHRFYPLPFGMPLQLTIFSNPMSSSLRNHGANCHGKPPMVFMYDNPIT